MDQPHDQDEGDEAAKVTEASHLSRIC